MDKHVQTWERVRDGVKEYIKYCEPGDNAVHCIKFVTEVSIFRGLSGLDGFRSPSRGHRDHLGGNAKEMKKFFRMEKLAPPKRKLSC